MIPKEAETTSSLVLSGPDARRPPTYMGGWRASLKEFSNWVRLNMVLSAASYLELYIREIVTLALNSDPLAPLGLPRQIDGVTLLKLNHEFSTETYVNNCASGTWNDRSNNLNAIFNAGDPLSLNITELEKLRRLRNSVGHAFGRQSSVNTNIHAGRPVQSERLAEDRLKKWLKLLEETATQIDVKLCRNYVGFFEFLLLYHLTKDQLRTGKKFGKKTSEAALAMMAVEKFGYRITKTQCKAIIEHYRNC